MSLEFNKPYDWNIESQQEYDDLMEVFLETGQYSVNQIQQVKTALDFIMHILRLNEENMSSLIIHKIFRLLAEDLKKDKHFSPLFQLVENINKDCEKHKTKKSLKGTSFMIHMNDLFPEPQELPDEILEKAQLIFAEVIKKCGTDELVIPIEREIIAGEKKYIVNISSKLYFNVRESTKIKAEIYFMFRKL